MVAADCLFDLDCSDVEANDLSEIILLHMNNSFFYTEKGVINSFGFLHLVLLFWHCLSKFNSNQ